jgi:hypothetical protein
MKPTIKTLLKARRLDLCKANPKSRDRIRHKVRVLEIAQLLRKKSGAA